jgi:hypothetical protein
VKGDCSLGEKMEQSRSKKETNRRGYLITTTSSENFSPERKTGKGYLWTTPRRVNTSSYELNCAIMFNLSFNRT